jgi:hypothetical protein
MNVLVMKYFVLKPAGDDRYAQASRAAMNRYADMIAPANPELAHELRDWAAREHAEFYARTVGNEGQP